MATKKAKKSKSIQKARGTGPSYPVQARVETPKGHPIFGMATPPATQRSMPWFGLLGLGIMAVNEILLLARLHPVAVVFTAIMWTGYILLLDGWIWQRGGTSYFLDKKREFPMLFLISILLWSMFEVMNIPVDNWSYVNIAPSMGMMEFTAAWAYGTIIPALFLTWNFFGTFRAFDKFPKLQVKFTPFILALSFVIGVACISLPTLMSVEWAKLLVPCTWLGFILLVEPINYLLHNPRISIYRQLEMGESRPLWQLLIAGMFCGVVWESWNEQAIQAGGQGWTYHLAGFWEGMGFNKKWGEMPLAGFGGYPFFIWENFIMYELVKYAMQGDKLWKTATSKVDSEIMERAAEVSVLPAQSS